MRVKVAYIRVPSWVYHQGTGQTQTVLSSPDSSYFRGLWVLLWTQSHPRQEM